MRPDRLVTLGVATANVVVLVLALALVLHRNGTLPQSLGALSTESGLGLFIALWWVTWWSTRRGLRSVDPLAPAAKPQEGWLWLAVHRGGIAGSLFGAVLAVLLACQLVFESAANEVRVVGYAVYVLTALGYIVFFMVFASVPSFVLGMIAGLVLGCGDLLCLRLSDRLFRACTAPRATTP